LFCEEITKIECYSLLIFPFIELLTVVIVSLSQGVEHVICEQSIQAIFVNQNS